MLRPADGDLHGQGNGGGDARGARPRVLVARSAWARIQAEVERWARDGLRRTGSPFEAIAYPLSALVRRRPRAGAPGPLELCGPEHLDAIVVADVALPPDEAKHFGSHNCHFSGPDLAALNAAFNAEIDARIARAPRLEVHTKLHSHPFPGGDWLSGMDVKVNALTDGAVAWRERLGLGTALLQICWPHEEPARMLAGDAPGRWHLATFAVDGGGAVGRLPDARIVPDAHPFVRRALAPPYWHTDAGRAWDDGQKAALRAAGYRVSRGALRRGWRRYLVTLADGRELCVCLPPDPGAEAVRVVHVIDAAANRFAPLPLPRWAAAARTLEALDLTAMVRGFERRRRTARRARRPAGAAAA